MDSITNKLGGQGGQHSGQGVGGVGGVGGAGQAGGAAGNQDYGDKAFDMLAKKSGHNVNRNTGEKITDGARGLFEKATGKKVNPKISN
ncbi:hypothetical protein QBC33DRAFT_558911 [Phialemonium atrogriseum]|uniref:Uncharacterized protein n=1 Tax=Phialemonium atrogriseum TaxID=1093897 RepID=A0AAJ0C040_9PEZI|nr:uncharacterized protein QBC33DRAFT_558911 [Phialemonium atrogriseum]KAK1767431.1 hypothetical protein QBC33DRAFT_558911 [Phialemonium atrogriseum]